MEPELGQMLNIALEMERRGADFYQKAAQSCTDETAREVFWTLKADEEVHMERIRAIYESLEKKGEWSDEWEKMKVSHSRLDQIFQKLERRAQELSPVESDLKALDVGITLEEESIRFYSQRLEQARDSAEKRFLEAMVAEERGHFQALQDTKLYLTDPAAWFAWKERPHFDGG